MVQFKLDAEDLEQRAPGQFAARLEQLAAYSARLREVRGSGEYAAPESSLRLPDDEPLAARAQALAAEKAGTGLRYHIVVGIGGSNLGAKAVYGALLGYGDVLAPERFPKLLFAETADPEWLARLADLLATLGRADEVLVSVISKSGGTTETIANFEIVMQPLCTRFGREAALARVVAITDENSPLWQWAEAHDVARAAIPKPVGGRYSVLSAAGLVPLASAGVDIAALRRGAAEMLARCLDGAEAENIAAQSAVALALYHAGGCSINDNFFFHPELESLGKWYRQLMGESIGKERSLRGEVVHAGITPTVSIGSTDLHSVGQLNLGGPRDKITTFVYAGEFARLPAVPAAAERLMPGLVPMVEGQTAGGIMAAILQGVKTAYRRVGLPFMELRLERIDAYELGGFLQFKMLEMMYLGQLLGVDSFDQPNVESYKVETRRILEGE